MEYKMDIGRVASNIVNIAEYSKAHQKQQEIVTKPNVIWDLSIDNAEKEQKLVTYTNQKIMSNDQLWEQYSNFASVQIENQLIGMKAYIQGYVDGSIDFTGDPIHTVIDIDALVNELWEKYGFDGNLNPVGFKPGREYSEEKLSDAFVQFAKNISGHDVSKADLLLDAVKNEFAIAEQALGGNLPKISQNTYDLTVQKFEAWKSESKVEAKGETKVKGKRKPKVETEIEE
jgi:hypothetical protein